MQNNLAETTEQEENRKGLNRRTLVFLLGTAFLNMMGMSIIGPVLPFIVQHYLSNQNNLAAVVGWLSSVYAICQFIASPGLGVLSDRFGRRPLLLICILGSAIGYIMFGIGGALWVLFLSRIIDGLTGGNFSILFAYIADVSKPEERGRLFGLFGAISGIGFILGPAIGGLTARFGYEVPVYLSAAFTIVNLVWAYFNLSESHSKEHRIEHISIADLNPFKQLRIVFALPQLRWLLLAGFFYAFPFAVLTSNLSVLMIDKLGWQAAQLGFISLAVGAMDIITQGVLVGKLLPILGEIKLSILGLILQAISYVLLGAVAFIASPVLLIAGVALFAFSGGLVEPSLGGLLSRATDQRQQGMVMGGSQSVQAVARIIGPFYGGELYTQFGGETPYWSGAAIVGLTILSVILAIPMIRKKEPVSETQ
ncbi:MAG TPA: MFS transporter [Ktedonobacteraceae bacterium]|nr:MFS transporter [Ktedonobacteraceae bacterium]